MGASETGRVAESRSHDEGGGQRGRWDEAYGGARERDRTKRKSCVSASGEFVARLVAFAVPLLSRPPFCPFLFTSIEHAYTSAGRYIHTGVAVSSRVTSSIDKSTQVRFRFPGETYPLSRSVYDNLHQYQRSWCLSSLFFFRYEGF